MTLTNTKKKRGRKFGFKLSLESRKKLSEIHKKLGIRPPSQLGKIGYWKGKKRPNISIILKGHPVSEKTKAKIILTHLGRKCSEETKKKMSESAKRVGTGKWMRGKFVGEKHYKWKGTTPLKEQIRKCFEYRQWRSDIFTRDNFTCVLCGKKGGELNADHFPKVFVDIYDDNKIVSFEQARLCEEFWNINNGRTLCKSCHRKTDTWGRQIKKSSGFGTDY